LLLFSIKKLRKFFEVFVIFYQLKNNLYFLLQIILILFFYSQRIDFKIWLQVSLLSLILILSHCVLSILDIARLIKVSDSHLSLDSHSKTEHHSTDHFSIAVLVAKFTLQDSLFLASWILSQDLTLSEFKASVTWIFSLQDFFHSFVEIESQIVRSFFFWGFY